MDQLDCTVRNYFENDDNKRHYSNISDKIVDKRYEQLFRRYLNVYNYNLHNVIQPPKGFRIIPEEGCHTEQLTEIGALQHVILGAQLANVYRQKLNIDRSSGHKLMKVYSTTYQRTFQSAFAFMYGFIDPMTSLEYKHFPNILTTKGHLFCGSPQFCGKCDKLNYLFRSFEETRSKLLSSNKHTIDVVFKLRALISPSNKSSTFASFEALYDGVLTYLCHGSKVPCDDFNGCATTAEIEHLISSLENHYKSILKTKMYKKMNLMKTFGFYQQLIDHFESLIDDENHFKFLLFSGHDVTLIPISSVLDIYDGIIPPFASRLVFETYKNSNGNHYLRIVYNGKDLTKLAEICNSSKQCVHLQDSTGTFYSLILLDSFHHFIQDKLKELTNSDTFENACSYSI
ncbi:2-phosphoxylose phosphatase 1-like protein [Leptotrombidium deliense]|uniref:2-phosphoxylose phosphatase 1 n=1 Tax=Leptotrombidium deliense TaxID=299467 RepID=A0A443SHB1_9ACAR|nr:2-phosphoxylose phosphatase 1-like protein [Leptotrombidium deliense]